MGPKEMKWNDLFDSVPVSAGLGLPSRSMLLRISSLQSAAVANGAMGFGTPFGGLFVERGGINV